MKTKVAFVLGVLGTLLLLGLVLLMASRLRAQRVTMQAEPELTHMVYLPFVTCGENCATPTPTPIPTPHRVKAALSQCCGGVTCSKVQDYGAEWVSGWSPLTKRCGRISSPMIRDVSQLEAIKAGVYDLSDAIMPIQSFNEPENQDCAAGACISLITAITRHHEIEQMFPNDELTSPAFSPTWLQLQYNLLDFVDGYYDEYGVYPRFEVVAMHAYGTEYYGWQKSFNLTADEFDTALSELQTRGYNDLRVWVTEMGWWCNDPESMLAQMDAQYFLNAWLNKCDNDSRCQYINWFGITNGSYWFVVPLELNGQLTLPGQAWRQRFN